jgi:hypothetical protein
MFAVRKPDSWHRTQPPPPAHMYSMCLLCTHQPLEDDPNEVDK